MMEAKQTFGPAFVKEACTELGRSSDKIMNNIGIESGWRTDQYQMNIDQCRTIEMSVSSLERFIFIYLNAFKTSERF